MKSALITGASRGIGLAAAHRLASSGYTLFINSRNPEVLISLSQELSDLYNISCYAVPADVSEAAQVRNMYSQIYQYTDHLDVVINNAGISHVGLLQDLSEEDWDRVINTNLKSVFLCTKEALPPMIRVHSGCIINISSIWGCCGASMEVAYSASKGGINAFTQALAREVAPSGIRVNAIACGVIDTTMNHHLSPEERQDLADQIGLGRFGKPDEVADLIAYLASDQSTYLTGQVITLDGSYI